MVVAQQAHEGVGQHFVRAVADKNLAGLQAKALCQHTAQLVGIGIGIESQARVGGGLCREARDVGARGAGPGDPVLDGLRDRLKEYYKLGARCAKWRAVITIGDDIPSGTCIEANSHALARYAALCQEQGLVPMVEPEVIMDGDHDIETCYEVTEVVLRSLFDALYNQNVMLEGTILKASMVVPGKGCDEQASVEEVAESTLMCLKSAVPAILPGIVFLSGGQSDEDATAHLDAMNRMGPNPWPLSFSYGRAMQQAALKLWSQDMVGNYAKAQQTVFERAKANGLAALGQWGG